jgi:DNA-binding NtrC family response regulator
MHQLILQLVSDLSLASYFEGASGATLRPMLRLAAEHLAQSPFSAGGAKILRGTVHLRSADGYRRLVTVEGEPPHAMRVAGDDDIPPEMLPSANAWRWVFEHKMPIAIDVNTGRIQILREGALVLLQEHGKGGAFDSTASAKRLLDRNTSHLFVLPLAAPAGAVAGMIAIEATCRLAIGVDFIWTSCGVELGLLAGIAGPHLMGLPLRMSKADAPDDLLPVIGASMASCVRMLRAFAAQEETILLGGPTGAGKSRLARWCHTHSSRSAGPFERLDLITVPESLQLGELFGWKKGAFTGANRDSPGRLARAQKGTLFVDEVDKLTLRAQAALLEVLDDQTYRPLGEERNRIADVRFIIGTNRDLQGEVRAGRFLEDLYYRINVLPLQVPPLDDRRDEIPQWAAYFATRHHQKSVSGGMVEITAGAERALLAARWPGNLRQLDNIVRRAYAMTLVEHEGSPEALVLEESHVLGALAYEGQRSTVGLLSLLHDAAAGFVREMEQRAGQEPAFDLRHADAFAGFVLGTAVQRFGKEAAYKRLGKEALLLNRNHHRDLKREVEKVRALWRALGEPGQPPFRELLDKEDGERL